LPFVQLRTTKGCQSLILTNEGGKFLFLQLFQIEEAEMRTLGGADQLIQLQLHRHSVAVLGVLNQEDHKEGDDRRAGVDHQLPGVGIAEDRPGDQPDHDQADRKQESDRAAGQLGDPAGSAGVDRGVIGHGINQGGAVRA